MRKILFSFSLWYALLFVQTPQNYHSSFSTPWQVGLTIVPSTNTAVCGANPLPCNHTVYVEALVLANTTASAVTVMVTDNSTNCSSAACQIFPAVSIAANMVYTVNLLGVQANSGLKWQASTANAVHGYIKGRF